VSAPRAALVDYGAGNLRSVGKALERSGFAVDVTDDPARIRAADTVVLPGVGAFADSMATLRSKGLDDASQEAVAAGKPYLGLCLGLQLLFDESDEHAVTKGFGLLAGRVERFPERSGDGTALCVPHIGWNEVRFAGDHPMLAHLPERDYFYFVHSYRPVPSNPKDVVGHTDYGGRFASAVAHGLVFAAQFHPEKSQAAGKRLLDAFAAWVQA
jgi:glutamine amidotransferase